MRAVKVKAIRRAMRPEIEKGSHYVFQTHPKLYINARGEQMLKYTFQYILQGGLKLVKFGKKLYRAGGILPKENASGRV